MKIFFLYLIVLLGLIACNNEAINIDKNTIARVNSKYLYASDIEYILNYNTNSEDSAELVREFIKNWINEELKLIKAENNISNIQSDVNLQLLKYRNRLIINKYEQKIIQQKLDTIISETEINQYYLKYPNNFILNETYIKGLFIKVPKASPKIYNLIRWYKSAKEEDTEKTKQYCFDYADMYEDFNGEWVNVDIISNLFPINIKEKNIQNKYIEQKDSLNKYLLNIDDKKLIGDVAPINIVRNEIKKIILNKRKIDIIKKLEVDAFENAKNKKQIEIY